MSEQPFFVGLMLLFPLLPISILIFLGVRARRRLPQEEGRTPLYTKTCGGYIGWLKYGGPFIHVRAYEDLLVIGLVKPIVLRYEQIDSLETLRGLRFGLRIHHHHPSAPAKVVLSMLDHQRAKALFEERRAATLAPDAQR